MIKKNQQIYHYICLKVQFELFKGEIGGYTTAVFKIMKVCPKFGKIFNLKYYNCLLQIYDQKSHYPNISKRGI